MAMDKKIEKKYWTKGKFIWLGASILLLGLIIFQLFFANNKSRMSVNKEKVTVSVVSTGLFNEFVVVNGAVQPLKTIHIDAIEGGYVKEKVLEGGTMINSGDVILRLENNRLQMEFVTQETEINRLINELQNTRLRLKQDKFNLRKTLNEVEYQLAQAKDNFERNQTLYDSKVLSEQEYQKSKRDYEKLKNQIVIENESQKYQEENSKVQINQLEGTLQNSKRNLQLMRENLNNLLVRAPISGLLSSIEVEVGSNINAGQNIAQIDDISAYKMRAGVDEVYISKVFVGLPANMEFNGKAYSLKISKVYPEVKNGRFEVDLAFDKDAPEGIKRGQSASIRIELGNSATQATLLPSGGFYSETGGNWVYVLSSNGKSAEKRVITLGRRNPDYFEVIEGLKPGEKVIISSYANFGKNQILEF